MKKYKFKINGQTFEVEIGEFDGNNAVVNVNGTPYDVEIQNDTQKAKTPVLARKPVMTAPGEGQIKKSGDNTKAFKVNAPLPGSIFKMKVKVGDTVKEGDCLLVMEAMKMENNVLAEKGGVIKSIAVKEGDTVLQGDLLIEIA